MKLEGIFQEKAKANLKLADGGDRRSKEAIENQGLQNSAKVETPLETRAEIAKIAHVSTDTVSKVKFIEENATDEQKDNLQNDKTSILSRVKRLVGT